MALYTKEDLLNDKKNEDVLNELKKIRKELQFLALIKKIKIVVIVVAIVCILLFRALIMASLSSLFLL